MLARYKRVRELGQGGFGTVYLAEDQATGTEVALKLLNDGTDADHRKRFAREIRLLRSQVNNRYVVEVLDFDAESDPPYLVMEYCDGGSLRAWVGAGRPWQVVATALSHAIQGVSGLHFAGGFHRDLKPDNLLVGLDRATSQRIVKVGDFGIARVPTTTTGTMTRSGLGTPGYVAPEIMVGGDATAESDIYSLGITGIELLTGALHPKALPSAAAPESLVALLRKMTALEPAARPNAFEVAADLARILAQPPQDPPRAPQPPPAQPASPRPALPAESGGLGPASLLFGGGLLLAALAMLGGGGGKDWDASVQRYRGRDGKFRS